MTVDPSNVALTSGVLYGLIGRYVRSTGVDQTDVA